MRCAAVTSELYFGKEDFIDKYRGKNEDQMPSVKKQLD